MCDASSTALSSWQLLEKADKLLDLFVAFHEDFDLLRHIFAPRSTSTRRSLFNHISDSTDIKLIILRDSITSLLVSLEEPGFGGNGEQQRAFQTLKADLEGKIKVTAKLRRKLEGEAGYKFEVRAPRFKVIGNHVESTGDECANAEQPQFSQKGAFIDKDREQAENPQRPQAMRGMITIGERLLQNRMRINTGSKSLGISRSTSPIPPPPALPVDQSRLITVRGSASMFPVAHPKAGEVLKVAGPTERTLQSPSHFRAGNKLTNPSAMSKTRCLSSPRPIPSSPQRPRRSTSKRKLTKSVAGHQKISRRRKNRLVIPSSDDEDVEEGHNEAGKAQADGGTQATESPKETQSAGPKNTPPTPLKAIKARASSQKVTTFKIGSLGLSSRTPGATSVQAKKRAHVSLSHDVYDFLDDDDNHDANLKNKRKGKQSPTQKINQVVKASTQPPQSIPKRTNEGHLELSRAKDALAKEFSQPLDAEDKKIGPQSHSKNRINRPSYGAAEEARNSKRQKIEEKEEGSQAPKSLDDSVKVWGSRNSSSWDAIHRWAKMGKGKP